ncbi:MAG: hypothetical protein ACOYVD_02195 [Bacillota bacterium]
MDKQQFKSIIGNFTDTVLKSSQGEKPGQEVTNAVWEMFKQLNPEAFKAKNN